MGTKPGLRSTAVHIAYPVLSCLHSSAFLFGCFAVFIYLMVTAVSTIYGFSDYGVTRFIAYQVREHRTQATDAETVGAIPLSH